MRPERAVLRRDDGLDDPVVRRRAVVRPAVDVPIPKRHAQHVPDVVAHDRPAEIPVRPLVRPVNDEPRYGRNESEREEQDDTSPPQTRQEACKRPPKPRGPDT